MDLARLLRYFAPALVALLLLAGCTPADLEPTSLAVVPTEPTATPSPTPIPTTAPLQVPTPTPVPTATPIPTPTPLPTATTLPTATAVPTPLPTSTPLPTAPPAPTVAPEPTSTPVPEPTPLPAPTATPEPTPIPGPTPALEPTAAAEPTAEPAGEGGPPADHIVTIRGYVTLGQAGLASLTMPAARVELIGFHEASHPGAQGINTAASGLPTMVLGTRNRGTDARSAADIVVPPGEPLVAPVTGTVVSSKTYVLYCEHQDKLVYIEPDGLPGWQVRLFHVRGETPSVGTRVIAGETIIATEGANPLPFESQIDKFTSEPSWPHAHLEVVDTSVPDDRPPGGGC